MERVDELGGEQAEAMRVIEVESISFKQTLSSVGQGMFHLLWLLADG